MFGPWAAYFLVSFGLGCDILTFSTHVVLIHQVRDYANKKKSAGGKLVDATAETDAEMTREMDKIAKQYGGGAGTGTQFNGK